MKILSSLKFQKSGGQSTYFDSRTGVSAEYPHTVKNTNIALLDPHILALNTCTTRSSLNSLRQSIALIKDIILSCFVSILSQKDKFVYLTKVHQNEMFFIKLIEKILSSIYGLFQK